MSGDIEEMKFNTAIAAMMTLVNEFYKSKPSKGDMKILLLLLSPFAPHVTEEMWQMLGFEGRAMAQSWPEYDEAKTVEQEKELAVQVNGKLKSTVKVPAEADDDTVLAAAQADGKVARAMEGMELVKTIVVKDRLVNLILRPKK